MDAIPSLVRLFETGTAQWPAQILGVVVLGEDVTAMVIAGIALVQAGVALTRRHPKAAEP